MMTETLLHALIPGFWKLWLRAYGGEKGKNIAHKEDLGVIICGSKGVTAAKRRLKHDQLDDSSCRERGYKLSGN